MYMKHEYSAFMPIDKRVGSVNPGTYGRKGFASGSMMRELELRFLVS